MTIPGVNQTSEHTLSIACWWSIPADGWRKWALDACLLLLCNTALHFSLVIVIISGRLELADPRIKLLACLFFQGKPTMKQSLLVAALIALAVTACGKKEEAPAPAPAAEAPAAAPAAEASAPAAEAPAAEASAPAAEASPAK